MHPLPRARRWRGVLTALLGAGALVLVLGTSVTAAGLITGTQVKDGTVTGRDLRDGSATGLDVRDGSLTPADFAGTVEGPRGPAGLPGPAGPVGPRGVRALGYYVSGQVRVTPQAAGSGTAVCPEGALPMSGGFATAGGPGLVQIWETAPFPVGKSWGWRTDVTNDGSTDIVGYAWVVCALTS